VAWQVLQPVVIAILVVALLFLVWGPVAEQLKVDVAGVSHFSSVYSSGDLEAVDDVIAGDDVTVAGLATIGETLHVTGASSFAAVTASGVASVDSLAVTGVGLVGTWLQVSQDDTLTLYDGDTITVTQSFMPLTAGIWITTSTTTAIVSATVGGSLLFLTNMGTFPIVIKDAANTQSAGDITLGQYDSCVYVWNKTDWIMLALSNN